MTIAAARIILAELTAEIERLRTQIQTLQPAPNPPTAAECNAQNQILQNGACQNCEDMTPRREGNFCLPLLTGYDTEEYRLNWHLDALNALYAYERGFRGQGITVGMVERAEVFTNHVDLKRLTLLPESRKLDFHATFTAWLVAGARNGIGGHGVAFDSQVAGRLSTGNAFDDRYRDSEIKFLSLGNNNAIRLTTGALQMLKDSGRHDRAASIYLSILTANKAVMVAGAGNATVQMAPFSGEFNGIAPLLEDRLEPHWINAVALEQPRARNNFSLTLAWYSNACGVSKNWCVAAPVTSLTVASARDENRFVKTSGGTSAAAPIVAGVLAVMKSARPKLPATIHRAIMLTTAADLGDPGIDDLYGWGMPNLETAINHILTLQTANLAGLSAVPLRSLRHEFPAEFSRLRGQLSELTVAIEITDGAYYNMPLADIIPPQTNRVNFGNAAEELLADNAQNQQNGFAAFGDSDNGFGLRWHNNFQSGGMHAELSYLPKTSGIVGAETAAKIGLRRPLFGGFMFGEYGGGFAKTQTSGGYVAAAEDISTEEWTMGAEVLDILRAGDKLRFSVRSGKRIRGGKVRVSLPVASGDFYQSFLGEKMQDLHISRQDISLSENAPLIYSAGYSVRGEKTEWAMAAELSETGDGKLSAKWRAEF